jgi:hypothetical protein
MHSQRLQDLSFAAFALGYLTHFSLKSFFTLTHNNFHPVLACFLLGYTALAYASAYASHFHLLSSLFLTWLLSTSYITGLLASLVLYRSFFSPLKDFPGPIFARITGLWELYQNLDGNFHRKIRAMFDEYDTDYLRIGPNELISRDAAAAQHIYVTSE